MANKYASAINVYPGIGSNEGGGSGTVTQINTGAGLTGGPITTSGTVSMQTVSGVEGSYTNANVTINSLGQVTDAADGGSILNDTPPLIINATSVPAAGTYALTEFANVIDIQEANGGLTVIFPDITGIDFQNFIPFRIVNNINSNNEFTIAEYGGAGPVAGDTIAKLFPGQGVTFYPESYATAAGEFYTEVDAPDTANPYIIGNTPSILPENPGSIVIVPTQTGYGDGSLRTGPQNLATTQQESFILYKDGNSNPTTLLNYVGLPVRNKLNGSEEVVIQPGDKWLISNYGSFTTPAGAMSALYIGSCLRNSTENTPETIVQRDSNGDFSAGTITADLNGNASTVNGFSFRYDNTYVSAFIGLATAPVGNTTATNYSNFGFGAGGMTNITTATQCVGMGTNFFVNLTTGSNDNAFGAAALYSLTSGSNNTADGAESFRFITTQSNNTGCGRQTGFKYSAYTNCTFMGAQADASVNGLSTAGSFGYLAQIAISNAYNIGVAENLGINQPSPAQSLHVSQGSTTNTNAILVDYTTNAPATPTAGFDVYGNSSHQVFIKTADGTAIQINKSNGKTAVLATGITAATLNAGNVTVIPTSSLNYRISDIQIYSSAGIIGVGETLSIRGASSGNIYATFPVSGLTAGTIARMGIGGLAGANWQDTVVTEDVILNTSGTLTSGTLSVDVESVAIP